MNMTALVEDFLGRIQQKTLNIAVIGDAMLDETYDVTVNRLAPEAPVPVLRSQYPTPIVRPGGAANVAYQLCHLNAQSWLIAPLDWTAAEILSPTIRTTWCVTCPWDVPRKRRFMADGQILVRHDIEDGELDSAELDRVHEKMAGKFHDLLRQQNLDAVIFSDYAKGALSRELIREVISTCRHRDIPVLVDPKGRPHVEWRGCSAIKFNANELPGWKESHIQVERHALGCDAIIVTQGSRASSITTRDGTVLSEDGPPVQPRCVSGAGDCFLAWLAVAVCHGLNCREVATLAHLAGKCYVGHTLNEPVRPEEVLGLVDPVAAKLHAGGWDRRKVVFTNGAFDVLHSAHVQTLQWARAQGDWLLVGLNSDESVRRLKGTGRPVMGQQDRARILASLACVDQVVIFDEDTPEELMARIRPAILVKGHDYEGQAIPGALLAGEVRIAPDFGVQDHSTEIIRKVEALTC